MVDDFRARHEAYCQRQGYEFCPDPNCNSLERGPADWGWNKLFSLRHYLRQGKHSHIFWMDADVIVTDLSADMRDTVGPDKWLGMGGTVLLERLLAMAYNTGVMYLYACRRPFSSLKKLATGSTSRETGRITMSRRPLWTS